jgi:peptidoglycan/LPS O-acetylase OafA/YrhL
MCEALHVGARRVELELHYRKDIDGLRAIAVLLVVLFHVHPRRFTGGFIGVDVFFVISGFLITGLICSGLRDGSFSLLDFYARRIRRIFPALAIVLAASMVAGWLVLFPADYLNLGKHVAASAAFVANFTLLQDTGYFDTPSALKPVLHLWSLGIEEQFYLLWPTLMLLAWRRRRAPLVLACAILAASFAWNVQLRGSDPAAAFFLPTTRFWELMVGCILALVLPATGVPTLAHGRWARATPASSDAASLLGGVLVAVGVILIGGGKSFTAWWALLPVLGAALLIAAGPGALINRQLLSRAPLVQLGLISYPLYLWHWPILAFMRHYHFKEPSDLMRWGGIALAIALAALTYRLVENPIRRGAPIALKPIGAAVVMLATGFAGAAVFAAGGYQARFPRDVAALLRDDDNVAKTFVGSGLCVREARQQEFALTDDCRRRPAAGSTLTVVWGDSHAANLVRGLVEIEQARPSLRVVFFATIGCPPIPSYAHTHPRLPDCPAANRVAVEKIGSIKPDTLILAANWGAYDGGPNADLVGQDSIREVVDRLTSIGVRRIVGVGQFPVWDYAVPKLIARDYRDGHASPEAAGTASPLRSIHNLDARTFAADQNARQWFLSAGAAFVSPLATLCNDAGCLLTVPGRVDPMDRDEDHMTNAGSVWFAANNAKSLLGE